jgi:hypothetical protein
MKQLCILTYDVISYLEDTFIELWSRLIVFYRSYTTQPEWR